MKKKLLAGLLASCAVVGLASCQEDPTVSKIEISGQDTEFTVGEAFDDGELVVTATFSDGSTNTVVDGVTVDSSNVDTSKAGVYSVVVSYEGKSAIYNVTVVAPAAPENVSTLKAVEVNATDVKTQYVIGEEVSLENLVVYETYANTIGGDTVTAVTDLSGYTVKVVNEDNEEVTGAFSAFGNYTVTVSKGEFSDGYTVRVGANFYDSVEAALEVGLANADKVNAGTISTDYATYEYEFGKNNYLHVVESYTDSSDHYHYELAGEDQAFGVHIYEAYDWEIDGYKTYVEPVYDASVDNLSGVNLSYTAIYGAFDAYGVESLVEELHYLGKAESSTNYEESFAKICPVCGIHNTYSFAYNTVVGDESDWTYYTISVSFSLSTETNAIEEVSINVSEYYSYQTTKNEETGVVTLNEGAIADTVKAISISQSFGERTLENEYTAESLAYESFDLLDSAEQKVENNQVIDAFAKEPIILTVSAVTPNTALNSVDPINVDITDEAGKPTWSAFGSYDETTNTIKITSYKVGKFNVTVSTLNVTHTFVINVGYAELTDFAPAVYDSYGDLMEAYSAETYTNEYFSFGAFVNEGADSSFTAVLKEETTNAEVSSDGSFTASVAGEYVVVLTSTVDPSKTAELTITVKEAPQIEEVLNGTYEFASMMLGVTTYVFTPASEGALSGTLSISNDSGLADPVEYTYNLYPMMGNYLDIQGYRGEGFGVILSGFDLICTYNGFEQGTLVRVGSSEDPELPGENDSIFVGVWENEYTNPRTGMTYYSALVFNADGTGTYNLENSLYAGTFTWEEVEGAVVFANITSSNESAAPTLEFAYDDFEWKYVLVAQEGVMLYHVQPYTKVETEEQPSTEMESVFVGTWENEYTNPRTGMTYSSSLVFNADGTGTYSLENELYVGTFTWEEVEGAVVFANITSINESAAPTLEFAYDDFEWKYVLIAQEGLMLYHVQPYTKAETEEGNESDSASLIVGENTLTCDFMGIELTFTATEAGTYTFQTTMADGYLMQGTMPTATLETTLEAGQSYTFELYDNNNDGTVLLLITQA